MKIHGIHQHLLRTVISLSHLLPPQIVVAPSTELLMQREKWSMHGVHTTKMEMRDFDGEI